MMHESHGVEVVVEMLWKDVAAARDPEHFQSGQAAGEFDVGAVHGPDA